MTYCFACGQAAHHRCQYCFVVLCREHQKFHSARGHEMQDVGGAGLFSSYYSMSSLQTTAGHSTPLIDAAQRGDLARVEQSLQLANQRGVYGQNALFHAVLHDHRDCALLLLRHEEPWIQQYTHTMISAQLGLEEQSPELLKRNWNKRTALMYAAMFGHTHLVQSYSCETGLADENGFTALMFAAANGHAACVQLLLAEEEMQTMTNTTALTLAAERGHAECIRLLRKETNKCGVLKYGALLLAARNGHLSCLQLLTDKCCANELERKQYELSALKLATRNGHVQCVKHFMRAEGITDHQYTSALAEAAMGGQLECARLLLSYKFQLNCTSMTALMHAMYVGASGCVKPLLWQLGQINGFGSTALTIYLQRNQIVDAVLQHLVLEAGVQPYGMRVLAQHPVFTKTTSRMMQYEAGLHSSVNRQVRRQIRLNPLFCHTVQRNAVDGVRKTKRDIRRQKIRIRATQALLRTFRLQLLYISGSSWELHRQSFAAASYQLKTDLRVIIEHQQLFALTRHLWRQAFEQIMDELQ